jgi:four helix bundle protein
VKRKTPNVEWLGVRENEGAYTFKRETPNAQRPTPNAQVGSERTPNAQSPTSSIEWLGVREDDGDYSSKITTPNAQRSTLNAQLRNTARFDLEDRLLDFSARIIRLVDALPNTRAANHVAGQLLRCGTSPYGNHGEVEAAESRRDFVHKLRICLKELKETRRWLRLLQKASLVREKKMGAILGETEELIKIFFTSVRTAEKSSEKDSS